MALDIGALAGKVLEKIPWPILVAFALMAGWVWYERSSKVEAVAEAQQQVAATDNDKQNLRIEQTDTVDKLKAELCACRVNLARSDTALALQPPKLATKYPPRSVVQNPKPEPESDQCE